MRVLARVVAAAFFVASLPDSLPARIDKPQPQVNVEARIVEVSKTFVREVGVFTRLGANGKPDLLLAFPSSVAGQPVDRAEVTLGSGTAKDFRPSLLPPGWKIASRKDVLTFSGPSLVDRKSLAIALDGTRSVALTVAPRIVLESGTAIVLDIRPEIRPLNPVQTVTDLGAVLVLPQRLAPGDRVQFAPLDPTFTPGGGTWRIGGIVPAWNGDFDRPLYRFTVPEKFGAPSGDGWNLRAEYIDSWNTRLVDGTTTASRIVAPAFGSGRPRVDACSPQLLAGSPLCLCGNFPAGSVAELRLNGQPIDKYLVASSPSILDFVLPNDFPSGSFTVGAGDRSGFEITDGAGGVLIHVGGEIDRNKLKRGESTVLKLWLDGTDKATDLRVWNSTPGIVRLAGGNDQVVTTSGGAPNQVTRDVDAVSPGDFALHYQLTVDSCPCARQEEEEREQPSDYDDFGPPQPEPDYVPPPIRAREYYDWTDKLEYWHGEIDDVPCRNPVIDELLYALRADIARLEEFLAAKERAVAQWVDEESGHSHDDHRQQDEWLDGLRRTLAELKQLEQQFLELPPCDPNPPKDVGPRGGDVIPPQIDLVIDLPDDVTTDCREQATDCDELLRRARSAQQQAEHLREEAAEANRPVEAYDRDQKQLDVLERQAAETRALEKSALDRVAASTARAKANPGKGYGQEAVAAQNDANKYAASAERLENQAHEIELQLAGQSVRIDFFRKQAAEAKRAADAAERAAARALQAYLDCLKKLAPKCPGAHPKTIEKPPEKTTGGGPGQDEKPGSPPIGSDSTGGSQGGDDGIDRAPGKCGPDVTAAFEATLDRTIERYRGLPAKETGSGAGARFLDHNWSWHWYKSQPEATESGAEPKWEWDWDDLLELDVYGPLPFECARGFCARTHWLWGKCVPTGLIIDIYEDFVSELFDPLVLPLAPGLVEGGGGGAPAKPYLCETIAKGLVRALLPKGSSLGGDAFERAEQAFIEAYDKGFLQAIAGSPRFRCEPCGATIDEFPTDWSRRTWDLSDGRVQHPDGTIGRSPTSVPQVP
jgi:hypothetical protein